jgi:hypothetical protein
MSYNLIISQLQRQRNPSQLHHLVPQEVGYVL